MRRFTTVLISILLVSCMMLQLCGCNRNRADEAYNLCTLFCEDVKNGNPDKLMTYFNGSDITSKELNEIINPSGLNSEEASVATCIKESVKYKVQEPVYDYKAKTATVYISWEQADYNSEAANASKTLTELKTAIITAPTNFITVCVTVDFNGEAPKIVNPKDVIDAVYAYNSVYSSVDFGIMPGILSDFYKDGDWVMASKGVYTNTKEIGVRLGFKKELMDYRIIPGLIYTVALGDKVIYTSDVISLKNNSTKLTLDSEMTGPEGLNEDGFLKDGKYTIMVFDEHSNDIAVFTCDIKNEEIEKDVIEFEEFSDDHYLTEAVYDFKDDELKSKTIVNKSGWWDYDGTSVGKSAFGSDTAVLGFSLAVNQDNDTELYYEYYFSEDAEFSDINEMKPVYQMSCKPSQYKDQSCYDLDYPSTNIKPGFYGLVVYGDAAKKHIVFIAACMVVEESSDEATG